jgi:NAD(P)-dependent dehydrogenase (short-subunit alcohol dehydrogenase family)
MSSKWTAEDIPDLTDKVAIVTGANSGIGFKAARALDRKGAMVILACRNEKKGKEAVERIQADVATSNAELMLLDLSNLVSINEFADEFKARFSRLDILINNAGIMMTSFGKSADGFELQFGTNHLGPFALTGLMLDRIIQTSGARVVAVSSIGHHMGRIDFEDLNAERSYNRTRAYTQSKLANLLFTYELQRRLETAEIDAIATVAHPGWTATNLQAHTWYFRVLNPVVAQSSEMGALPMLYAATAPDVKGGDYYGPGGWREWRGYPKKVVSSKRSYDVDVAARLWEVSERLTGVQYKWPTN